MLQDINRKKKTEIDFMNGAVAALADKHGIDAPCNTCIAELIRFREELP
jgi:2-dehydropantoate 2-reductase